MNFKLLRPYHPTTLGLGPTLLFVFMPAFALAVLQSFVFVSNLSSANWRHVVFNFYLVGFLGLAYLVWWGFRLRGGVSIATGAGFVIAGYAMLQRVYCEFLLSTLTGEPVHRVYPDLEPWIALARGSGLVGLVFGLALVLAACLAERGLRRGAPSWAFPE